MIPFFFFAAQAAGRPPDRSFRRRRRLNDGPRGSSNWNYFYSIARGLSAPGPWTCFCRAAKVGKNALKPGGLRIPYITGGVYFRYDLQISGLSSVPWAVAGAYSCAQFYRYCWLPRGTRHEGLAQGCIIESLPPHPASILICHRVGIATCRR